MSGLLGVGEELKVFKCPNCSQYISSKNDVCPKCSFQIPDELKQAAIIAQDNEVKEANRKFYKTMIYAGLGEFGFGALLLLGNVVTVVYAERTRISIWGPFLTILGIGQIIYAMNGLRKEK
jgi:RNA polymerase subunit RPABC4/transcription elongation factor Spt4